MKALRIAQWVVLALFGAYLLLLHNANPNPLALPFLPTIPAALLIAIVALTAYLIAALPPRWRLWRLQRKLQALTSERDGLQLALAEARREEPSEAVIPDRRSSNAFVEDPSDHL
jgi:hypothetical protein